MITWYFLLQLIVILLCVCFFVSQAAVEGLTSAAVKAVSEGADVIILSDRTDEGDRLASR